jgi:hypothetical protein
MDKIRLQGILNYPKANAPDVAIQPGPVVWDRASRGIRVARIMAGDGL